MNEKLKINNRRYIGSKTNLLKNIEDVINANINNKNFSIADIFGGTGVVANYFYNKGHKIIVNDNLYSNYVCYKAFMSNEYFDNVKVEKYINKFNSLDSNKIKDNYFSDKFSNKYYSYNDAKIIGHIREFIEKIKNSNNINDREYYILLTSLLYEADRIANTCGHFESFLNTKPVDKGVQLKMLDILNTDAKCEIYCEDSNSLVKRIKSDIVYVDPPYNARQYVNFYHLLENLATWKKPEELEGNSMKFKRNHLKSEYSRAKAPIVFKDLIDNIDAKLIVVSYNNTYSAKSTASNNRISEDQLLNILKSKGKVIRKDIDYKYFNAGKTDLKGHKEYLYVCEVKK